MMRWWSKPLLLVLVLLMLLLMLLLLMMMMMMMRMMVMVMVMVMVKVKSFCGLNEVISQPINLLLTTSLMILIDKLTVDS